MGASFVQVSDYDLAQSQRGRGSVNAAFAGIPVPNERAGRGVRLTQLDVANPQRFWSHPNIRYSADSAALGVPGLAPTLPGRPPAGWDGEMGADAPNQGQV